MLLWVSFVVSGDTFSPLKGLLGSSRKHLGSLRVLLGDFGVCWKTLGILGSLRSSGALGHWGSWDWRLVPSGNIWGPQGYFCLVLRGTLGAFWFLVNIEFFIFLSQPVHL